MTPNADFSPLVIFSISFIRLAAKAMASAGGFWVFFTKRCTTPIRASSTKNRTRAMRLPARSYALPIDLR